MFPLQLLYDAAGGGGLEETLVVPGEEDFRTEVVGEVVGVAEVFVD